MRTLATFLIALRALRRNKMRSMLTALGIIIGVAAVIAMVSIGNGASSVVEAQIASLGQNVILVFAGSSTSSGVHSGYGGSAGLILEDAEAIRREIPQVVALSPEVRNYAQIAAGNQNWYTKVLGNSADYFDVRQWMLSEGAAFTEQDVRGANKVCVIGKTVAHQIFGDNDPVGQILRVKHVPFMITGVLTPKGLSVMGDDQDDCVLVPYTSAMKRVFGGTTFRSFYVQVAEEDDMAIVQQQVINVLRQRHNIRPGKDDDFTVRNQQEIAAMATATSKVMSMLLLSIACVSLVVGGIGIMNIMLVSVTERTREIGIRIAIGALGSDILLQFLIEAVALSSLGGLIGIGLGIGTSEIISSVAGWPTHITIIPIVLSFASSALVGIASGFYPAWKASSLDPIEALRYE
ncbi:MAG TPA: ABC transporter permease [Verrucomicrobiaceae bacterium]